MEFETTIVYRERKKWVNFSGGVSGCFTKEGMIELNLGKSRQATTVWWETLCEGVSRY